MRFHPFTLDFAKESIDIEQRNKCYKEQFSISYSELTEPKSQK